MKPSTIKLISAFLCLAVIGAVIVVTRTEVKAAPTYPTMFYNDRAWPRGDSMPMEKIYSSIYVPVTLFAQLPNVTVKKNEGQNLFVISNGDYWLTFNVKTDFAYTQNSEPMYWRSAFYHGDNYVPVRSVCSYLRLEFEEIVSPITGQSAIRICDGSQKRDFKDLIRERHPGFFPEDSDTTSSKDTDSDTTRVKDTTAPPPDTDEPAPELGERIIYITIEDAPGEYTSEMLDVLEEFDYKATFFITGDQLTNNAALLSNIAAGGHSIGLHKMSGKGPDLSSFESIRNDIDQQNYILSMLLKRKSHVWRAPLKDGNPATLDAEVHHLVRQAGYSIWDYNVDIPSKARTAKAAADALIKGIWDNETAIIRICENEQSAQTLRLLLEFIDKHSEVCDVRPISAAHYEFTDSE